MQFQKSNTAEIYRINSLNFKEYFVSENDVKAKWKRLRETFRKKLSEIPAPKSGDEGQLYNKIAWPYFNNLMFLKDQFQPRITSGNLCSPETITAAEENNSEEETVVDLEENSEDTVVADLNPDTPSSSASNPSYSVKRKRISKTDKIAEELLQTEKEKLAYLKEKEASRKRARDEPVDEDVAFFNSLLPHVQALQPHEKIAFRIKILQYLYDKNAPPVPEYTYTNL